MPHEEIADGCQPARGYIREVFSRTFQDVEAAPCFKLEALESNDNQVTNRVGGKYMIHKMLDLANALVDADVKKCQPTHIFRSKGNLVRERLVCPQLV